MVAARNLSPETLATHAAELYAPTDPLGDAVQMMTIHKSKGLEFDTVIVPGLHRETGGNESSLLLWDDVAGGDGREHLLVAPMKRKGATNGAPSTYDLLKKLEAERAAHEDERLLYVAATRAIRRLHLVGVAVADERLEGDLKPPASGTLLKLLWPAVAQPVFSAALAASPVPAPTTGALDPASFVPPLVRLTEVALPEALREAPGSLGPAGNSADLNVTASRLSLEASVGTLVHRCLELVARDGLEHWSATRVKALAPAYRRWLAQAGHSARDARAGAAVVAGALCQTLASSAGRWVLAPHDEAAAEQAWSSRDLLVGEAAAPQWGFQRGAVNHVIDRIFITAGCRWIIDYKTVHVLSLIHISEPTRPY